jgi:hypothetical protein
MSRFSGVAVTSVTTINNTSLEIINSSNTVDAFIKQITVSSNSAAAATFAVGRPAAAGITPTSPAALLDEAGVDTGLVTTAVAWGTAPTIPPFLRRATITNVAGTEAKFYFQGKGLRLAPGGTLTMWNLTGTFPVMNVTVEAEQDIRTITTPT